MVEEAAEAVIGAGGQARRLKRTFERSRVPMVIVDGGRRYVEANRPARLWFRLGLQEMREFALGELTPAPPGWEMERAWARLLDVGRVAGQYPVPAGDGRSLDLVYHALADVLPALHLIAFAPADWLEGESDGSEQVAPGPIASLTHREIEVLTLAADGFSGPELARELVLGLTTVNTHFKNIYEKLRVQNRAGAVAKAIRIGLIE